MSGGARLRNTLRVTAKVVGLSVVAPSVPVLVWWKSAHDDRVAHLDSVAHKVRVPNVQTVDDLLLEKCRPGDVVLFDRRCDRCAAGPGAAASCLVGRASLCDGDGGDVDRRRSLSTGVYDHVGVVVPGRVGDDLHLLEATSGGGIVSRPLLGRLEATRSRNVTLLPLSSAGEYRNDNDYEPSTKTRRLREYTDEALTRFRDAAVEDSETRDYARTHSLLSLTGAVAYSLGLHELTPLPVSPSAWLVVSALQAANVAENVRQRAALDARPEDFLRDARFHDEDSVRLRPGWKFLTPVTMRETSRL